MEFDCALTREIVGLIDRETDMLSRGRPEDAFKGVRQRLRTLFLEFCQTPAFNPESAKYSKVPEGTPSPLTASLLDTTPVTGLRGKKIAGAAPGSKGYVPMGPASVLGSTGSLSGGGMGETGGSARFTASARGDGVSGSYAGATGTGGGLTGR